MSLNSERQWFTASKAFIQLKNCNYKVTFVWSNMDIICKMKQGCTDVWMDRRQINGNEVVLCCWDSNRFAVPLVISGPIGGIKMNWSLLGSLWGGTVFAEFPTGHWKAHATCNSFIIMGATKHGPFVGWVCPDSKECGKNRTPIIPMPVITHIDAADINKKVQLVLGILESRSLNLTQECWSLGWAHPH